MMNIKKRKIISPKMGIDHSNEQPDVVSPRGFYAKVHSIADGDTATVFPVSPDGIADMDHKIKIRFLGIDAPETPKKGETGQAFSLEATTLLEILIADTYVYVEDFGSDHYGRMLGVVYTIQGFIKARNVNLALIQSGLAYYYEGDIKESPELNSKFKEAEEVAKEKKFGVWSDPDSVVPKEYRRRVREEKKRRKEERE